jgi:hypothetical protein
MSKITCAICLEKKPVKTVKFHMKETFTIDSNEHCFECVGKDCEDCNKAPKTYKGKMIPVCAGCDK